MAFWRLCYLMRLLHACESKPLQTHFPHSYKMFFFFSVAISLK